MGKTDIKPDWRTTPTPPQPSPRPALSFGPLPLATRYLLAPLAGYTNLPFRRVVREIGGVGLATTDLVNCRALLVRSAKTMELIQTCPEDRPLSVQIYGTVPAEMRDAAQWLENYGVASIDINMGCPVHKVVRGGGGSAMMCEPGKAIDLVRTIVEAVRLPVTVKMRLGWDDESWSAPYFARAFEEVGVAAVIVHGRTRAQGFGGRVNLAGIRAVVEAVKSIPIIGNGDVRSLSDAAEMLETTGCHGIAIGRGALLNPWIFRQLTNWELTGEPGPTGSYDEHLDFMHRHFHFHVAQRGEHFACLTFRKVANWYSKVLRPGHAVQQALMRIDSIIVFDGIVEQLRQRGPMEAAWHLRDEDLPVRVPSGPNERW